MENTELVKVSVVLCSYNGEAFIEEQVMSILNQTYPLHELIIVDDGSTDNTIAIIERLSIDYNLIRLYKNEVTLGYNHNFEKALQLATGDVLAISDQDDVWHLQKIEILLREWKNESLLIYCDSSRFENTIPTLPKSSHLVQKIAGKNPRKLSVYNTVSGHAIMLKKSLLPLALPFDKNVYYDWWLAIVAMANGGITFVPQILVYHRVHNQNATIKKGLSNKDSFYRHKTALVPLLQKFQTIPNLDEQQKKYFYQLNEFWKQSFYTKYNWRFFLFLMKNRKDIFSYKNRKIGFFSHLKHSWRFSSRNSQ